MNFKFYIILNKLKADLTLMRPAPYMREGWGATTSGPSWTGPTDSHKTLMAHNMTWLHYYLIIILT